MDALSSPEILLFGPFRFDRRGRLLFRCTEDGRYLPVSMGARALAVLEVLTERPGDLVSRDEIMGVAWPSLTVEEGNLTVQISTLRRILDAGSEGESCIQTVSGRGYRFIAGGRAITPRAARAEGASRLSLVVLPFDDLSGDRSQGYLADAITEDLTTDLSRVPGLVVVSCGLALIYKGRPTDARRLGEELSVRSWLRAVSASSAAPCE